MTKEERNSKGNRSNVMFVQLLGNCHLNNKEVQFFP